MTTLKYSRQREAIKNYLSGRTDHPTADMIYSALREEYPNISLGTVYRNLALLSDLGEIAKISTGNGADHYDATVKQHQHFICRQCHRVYDLQMDNIDSILELASRNFRGVIESYQASFFGICENCMEEETNPPQEASGA